MATEGIESPGRARTKTILCAVYTRKSTDENLNSGFTSLDSQREYCQAFIKSREGEGWRLHTEDYCDPGFSGGNINRPALRKLLSDARQGKFQVVVCYKYDRLSRNTKDFLHILDTFDRNGVAFVSVTQPIDTTSSVGRLMRSILVDFSQFEREMISERTRDKMAAMARKGKRTGGSPIIGFDIDRDNKRLRINPKEAEQVREMFNAYLQSKSLSRTAKILNEKGYRMKAWVTRGNKSKGGQKFNKASLWYLLQNPLYIGKITYRKQAMPGEHEAILPEDQFQAVQKLLRGNGNGRANKQVSERTHTFLLRGLVECACCKTTMTPCSALPRKKGKVYGRFYYYKCLSVVKMDKTACKVRSVSAKALEEYVVRRLEILCQNKDIVERIVRQSQEMTGRELPLKRDERKRQSAELGKVELEARNLVGVLASEGPQSPMRGFVSERLAELEAKRQEIGTGLAALDREIERLERRQVDAEVVRRNLGNFLKLFGKLTDKERVEIIGLLVKRVVYDGENSKVQIALRPLPDAWGDLDHLEGSFYDRKRWLRMLDALQTLKAQLNAVSPEQNQCNSPFWLPDESEFQVVLARRGRKHLAFPEEAAAVDRSRTPRPAMAPRIQALLRQARDLQDRLNREPSLTRDALAAELGMAPPHLTHILNLLNLAPEIQERILALPPSVTRGTLTERRLRPVARIEDRQGQLREFERLLALPERAVVVRGEVPAVPSQGAAPFFSSIQSSI